METAIRETDDRLWKAAAALAALIGWGLVLDCARNGSATYDEVTYLRVASEWWRTGRQDSITRMGSPLTFWKIQQAPSLWLLDRLGMGRLVDHPDENGPALLPRLRWGASWIWLAALALTSLWAGRLHGPRGAALAAWIFALSPNLIAHGALLTMEMPLIAAATGSGLLFTIFLQTGRPEAFLGSAALAGLAFSCKFTGILIPPICGLCWVVLRVARGERRMAGPVLAMSGYVLILIATNLVLTGFARIPPSERVGEAHPSLGGSGLLARLAETPLPQDWVGFATQMRHQRTGGPSYLLGQRGTRGWWYYYFVATAAKTPPIVWGLALARLALPKRKDALLIVAVGGFLAVTALGSSRNYGVRYVLPVAPLAIVWLSALAEGGRASRGVALIGVAGLAVAVATSHPRELAYFPAIVGGPGGGRRVLADSNLDWGQGLRDLARLQRERPEFRDLTLYYFGLARPETYGVVGRCHVVDASDRHPGLPAALEMATRFVAVSASLQFGPWGPPGYFARMGGVAPRALLPDASIAIYAREDLAHE